MTAVIAPPGTVLLSAERIEDGRWSIGYIIGPGGPERILLPETADPTAVTAAEIQAAIDASAAEAKGEVVGHCVECCRPLTEPEVDAALAFGRDPLPIRYENLGPGRAAKTAPRPRTVGWTEGGIPIVPPLYTLEAAPEPEAQAPGHSWRPTDDAPLREAVLVVWEDSDYEPHIACRWSVDGFWVDYREGYELDPPPTHWMPLPAPPKGDST